MRFINSFNGHKNQNMIQKLIYLLFVTFIIGCNRTLPAAGKNIQKEYAALIEADSIDKLIPITNEGELRFGTPCAFIDNQGDTIIPFGRFTSFETDTLLTFAFVKDYKNGVVGINRKGEILFDAFIYGDAQLDSYSEGLVRILQNKKIGFADKTGKIIIGPKYKCAYPFENGKAKVTYDCETIKDELEHSTYKSETWFYIDKKGKEIK